MVLCDFISMYPTAATLLRLWPFVIAENMNWRDATEEIRAFLEAVTLVELQRAEAWSTFAALVQVQPDGDIFPVRAPYEGEAQATIGLNELSGDQPLWFTLPDCIASKLLTGRAPKIIHAIVFEPGKPQRGLKAVDIHGNPRLPRGSVHRDFYKRLIELRQSVKSAAHNAGGVEKRQLDALEQALKIAANATSYGIFIETNVREHGKPIEVMVHPAIGRPYKLDTLKEEERGRFFHPLLATLITGAARLMLAITERLVRDAGLEWAFCDTDSMAIAKPKRI